MKKGIDVSEWNGNIDFKKVKSDGIDFVIVRAGWDMEHEDKYYKQNVNNAIANGLHVGLYWFMYFIDETEAINSADKFVRLANLFKGKIDYPLILDVEEDTYRYMKQVGVNPTKKKVTDLVKVFCKRVESHGYYSMIYSNYTGFKNHMNSVAEFDKWIADLDGRPDESIYGLWQYTFEGKVKGISGNVDMDYSFKDYPKIIREAGLNHLTKETKTETKPKEAKAPTTKKEVKTTTVTNTKLKVGDVVQVTNPIIYGTNKKFVRWYVNYNIIELAGNRAVIGKGKTVTAPIDIKYLKKV